jgi:hypothetical protein
VEERRPQPVELGFARGERRKPRSAVRGGG